MKKSLYSIALVFIALIGFSCSDSNEPTGNTAHTYHSGSSPEGK